MAGFYANAFDWPDEAVDKLKKLAEEGLSGSYIAKQLANDFGASVSRNAVIGKLYRMGRSLGGSRPPRSAGTVRRNRKISLPKVSSSTAGAIRDLHEDGVPRRQIVARLGVSYGSIAAVLGPVTDEEMAAKRARPHLRDVTAKRLAAWMEGSEKTEQTTGPTSMSVLVTLQELNPRSCRWPIGNPSSPDFRFCGAYKVDGHSYCSAHCRAAYTAPPARKPREDKRPVYRTEQAFRRFA